MSKGKAQAKVIDDATKQELVNIVNEAIINLKPLILDELKEDMTKLVQDVVATSLGEVVPKALDGIKEEVKSELTDEELVAQVQKAEEEEVPQEEVPQEVVVEEEKEAETEEEVPQQAIDGTVIEEEKEVPEKVPLSGIPASKEDVQYAQVANQQPVASPTYTIDSKAVADAVIDEIWSKLSTKRVVKTPSKLDEYKSQTITKKSKFLDNETRDKFGRNKKYL